VDVHPLTDSGVRTMIRRDVIECLDYFLYPFQSLRAFVVE